MRKFHIGDKIEMRPFKRKDAADVLAGVKENYEHLRPFLHWVTPDYSMTSARQFIEQTRKGFAANSSHTYGIFSDGTLAGAIGFVSFNWPSKQGEIGYWLAKDFEGKGIITQACKLLLQYAFNDLNLNRLEIRCAAENNRSRAIPERLGFTLEGILRQSVWRHDRFYDMAIYGMLNSSQ